MKRKLVQPTTLGQPVGPFSRVVIIGDIVHVAGTSALTHLSGPILERTLPASADEQAELTFANIGKALASAGCGFADVYRMLVIVKDAKYMAAVNKVRTRLIPGPTYISTAMVADLLHPGMLIEVEVSAQLP